MRGLTKDLALAIQVDSADLSIVTWKCFGDPSQGPSALLQHLIKHQVDISDFEVV